MDLERLRFSLKLALNNSLSTIKMQIRFHVLSTKSDLKIKHTAVYIATNH